MATIRLYKRSECKVKVDPKKAEQILAKQDVRVQRPSLLAFMVGGGFAKLPVTPTALIDSPYKRPTEQGFEIPLDSRGRKAIKLANEAGKLTKTKEKEILSATTDGSTKESVRIWIEKNLEQFGISREAVSVVIDND